MFNDIFILQTIIFITLIFYLNTINIITLWYLAGIYLIFLGLLSLFDDGDIFVGFLWVIDFGVGLIFFIFILHFSNFLHQKSYINISQKFFFTFLFLFVFFIIFFYFFSFSSDINLNYQLKKIWIFFISWYNYYFIFSTFNISELHLLREIYFYNNSFEFFLINFMLLYGIFTSINLCFLIKKFFTFLNFSQMKNLNILNKINSYFFIRNQNFINQQNTTTGTRVWEKKKYFNNDF